MSFKIDVKGPSAKTDLNTPTISKEQLDLQDARGRTALHNAVINKQPAQVANLLNAGADPNIRDKYGKHGFTPLWYAISQNRDPISVKLLTNAKAQVDQPLLDELLRQSTAAPLDRELRAIRQTLGFNK